MHIVNKHMLIKYKAKNLSNNRLIREIGILIDELENKQIMSSRDLIRIRKDADRIHSADIYFLNLYVHRVMVKMEFDDGWAIILWIGSHEKYVATFKNNKDTIEKWLKANKIL